MTDHPVHTVCHGCYGQGTVHQSKIATDSDGSLGEGMQVLPCPDCFCSGCGDTVSPSNPR